MVSTLDDALKEAELAVRNAQEVRIFHRKRTDRQDKQRQSDLNIVLDRLKAAMIPLRSEIGRFPHQPPTENVKRRQARIRSASLALQRERRKCWKMLNPPRKP